LWAAEDIEAVFDQDPQRVCILQGPVAVKQSKIKDEPIKELLGNINAYLIRQLLERFYAGDESRIPTVDYLCPKPLTTAPDGSSLGVQREVVESEITYTVGKKLPDAPSWLEELAGSEPSWLRALLTSTIVVQGKSYVDNPIRRLLRPRPSQKVVVSLSNSSPRSVTVYGAARWYGEHKPSFKAVEIQYHPPSKLIDVTMYEDRRDVQVPLRLQFQYEPSTAWATIHEVVQLRNTRIKEFYWKLWYGDESSLPDINIRETFTGPEITIDSNMVERFCAVVGNQDESFKTTRNVEVKAPMDFAIVTGWQVRD
jgi:fatty acid synthase subunit alpha